MTTVQSRPTPRVGWKPQEFLSTALLVAAMAFLVVNFLVTIPVSLAAIAASAVSAKTVAPRRKVYYTFITIGVLVLTAAALMAVFLLSADTVNVSETSVPAGENQ